MSSSLCPDLGVYAAIRMDPVAMVAHLDARAAEEAQEIRPKTYLILTAFGLSSPFSSRDWSVYNVRPVGPSLRAVNEKWGYESDMCVPIFPNEAHPAGRAPARPSPAFPYDNCYHWAAMSLDIRVLAREEGFDHTHAIELPAGEQIDMDSLLRPDLGRAKRVRIAREQAMSVPVDHPSAPESSPSPPDVGPSEDTAMPTEVDIFEPLEDFRDPEYIPLFHLWLNIADSLKQEDIGDPVDLYRERFAIMRIIKRAHERNPDLPTLREHLAPPQDGSVDESDSDSYMSGTASSFASEADEPEVGEDSIGKPKRFRAAKLLRKWGSNIRGLFCIPL